MRPAKEIAPRSAGRCAAAALIGLALGAGCNRGGASDARDETDRPDPAATIRIPLETPIVSLDPAAASDAVSRRVTSPLFDTVVDWRAAPTMEVTELEPELLIELPTVSDDGRTVRLTLPPAGERRRFAADPCLAGGASREVKAEDVRASLLRHADPTASGYALLAGRIEGFAAFASHDAREDAVAIRVVDENTVLLGLTRPAPELPSILANPQLAIVPPECVAYYDGEGRPSFGVHPVGSGPYVLDHARSEAGRAAVLRRRTGEPELAPPEGTRPAETIIFERVADPGTALELFRQGELDLYAPGQAQFDALISLDGSLRPGAAPRGTTVHRFAMLRTNMLLFVMSDPVLGQPAGESGRAIRRAVSLAFDLPRYEQVVQNGLRAAPARRLVPPGTTPPLPDAPRFPDAPLEPAPERAARVLAEAGVSPPRLVYLTGTSEAEHQEAELLTAALAGAGIELEVQHELDYLGRLLDPTRRGGVQLVAISFDADYPAPESFFEQFTCQGPIASISGFCDPAYDAGFERLSQVPAGARTPIYEALESALARGLPFRPIDHPQVWLLASPRLVRVLRNPAVGLRVEHLRVRE